MKEITMEEFIEIKKNATMEGAEQAIRSSAGFKFYVEAVKTGKPDTVERLQLGCMLECLANSQFRAQIELTALDLLFSMLDTKFRSEILGESEGK